MCPRNIGPLLSHLRRDESAVKIQIPLRVPTNNRGVSAMRAPYPSGVTTTLEMRPSGRAKLTGPDCLLRALPREHREEPCVRWSRCACEVCLELRAHDHHGRVGVRLRVPEHEDAAL